MEKMARAKMYIEKLANGINPLNGMEVSEYDIINNVRISRCLFYVADVLGQVINNNGIQKRSSSKKEVFALSSDQIANFEYFSEPVAVSVLVERINSLIDNNVMKKLKSTAITNWLVEIEMLEVLELSGGKTRKLPTEKGKSMGITTEVRNGMYGDYTVVLYNTKAQRFIMDNFDAVIAANEVKSATTKKSQKSSEWTPVQDEILKDLYRNNFEIQKIADFLKVSVEDVEERRKALRIE